MTHPKVDWSKAPEWAVAWSLNTDTVGPDRKKVRWGSWLGYEMLDDGGGKFYATQTEEAPKFGYRGTVENSLTLRPPKRKKMSKADRLRLEHGMTA